MSGEVLLLVDSNRCCQRSGTRGEMWIKCFGFSAHFECEMWMSGLSCWAVGDESCVESFFLKYTQYCIEMCVTKCVLPTILKYYIRIIISGSKSTLLSILLYVQDIQSIEMSFPQTDSVKMKRWRKYKVWVNFQRLLKKDWISRLPATHCWFDEYNIKMEVCKLMLRLWHKSTMLKCKLCSLLVSRRIQTAVKVLDMPIHPVLLPILTLSLFILPHLTSSFAAVIITTVTSGCNVTRHFRGHHVVLEK